MPFLNSCREIGNDENACVRNKNLKERDGLFSPEIAVKWLRVSVASRGSPTDVGESGCDVMVHRPSAPTLMKHVIEKRLEPPAGEAQKRIHGKFDVGTAQLAASFLFP